MSLKIGSKNVGPVSFGLMGTYLDSHCYPSLTATGFTSRPNPTPYDEAATVLKAALEKGANFWNGGEFYGPPNANSLQLLNHYFTKYPEDKDKVAISIKGGFSFHPQMAIDSSPENVRKCIDNSLKILDGKAFIDIWEPARTDPKVEIETTIKTIAEYVKAGKIGGIGLSECSAKTIRRAHAVHPITAVEVELSIFTTDPWVSF